MDVPEAPDVPAPEPGVVVMMCGLAGAGKTTYARRLEARGYTRLSVDEIIWRRIGHDAALLDPAEYEGHKATAEQEVQEALFRLIVTGGVEGPHGDGLGRRGVEQHHCLPRHVKVVCAINSAAPRRLAYGRETTSDATG